MAVKPISVSQLNRYIGRVMGSDPILSSVAVAGELSQITRHSSGHWYFDLKDSTSKIRCFLHAAKVRYLRFEPRQGMAVIIYGSISVYEAGGSYSLYVNDIELEGDGALAAAFEKLKLKLDAEGLFDVSHKRPLPEYPENIGVVTSPTGAAIRDIITTVKRRYPLVNIILYPALVQGVGSSDSICEGIEVLNKEFPQLDVLIVGRGGGSAEDLWSFNEENVARAIFASKIPVISAVGHEVDNVISDLVADVRAATPTAAAELAVPNIEELKNRMNSCSPEMTGPVLSMILERASSTVNRLKDNAESSVIGRLSEASSRLNMAKLNLDSQNPANILERGYTVVKGKDGKWKTSAEDIKSGDLVSIIFKDGQVSAEISGKENTNGW